MPDTSQWHGGELTIQNLALDLKAGEQEGHGRQAIIDPAAKRQCPT
jgi:hypothetical protein